MDMSSLPSPGFENLPATREEFIKDQQGDITLSKCQSSVLSQEAAKQKKVAYILDTGLLMRCWPGLKSDVVQYCCTCHVCQLAGKPNQVIPPAPLCPIPVTGEPFDQVIDCVGPLPKSKTGNQFLFTIMCASTRFPEAVPLRKITAPVITKALVKFFLCLVCQRWSKLTKAPISSPRCLPRP